MPRFLVQRTFPEGLAIPVTADGAKTCLGVVENNAEESVTWITSYVSIDNMKTFCIYDGPSPNRSSERRWPTGCPSTRSARCGSSTRTSTRGWRRDIRAPVRRCPPRRL